MAGAKSDNSWRRIRKDGVAAVLSAVQEQRGSGVSEAGILPSVESLLEFKRIEIYIVRVYPTNVQIHDFAIYKGPCAARSIRLKILTPEMRRVFEEALPVDLNGLENADLRSFLSDPDAYYLQGEPLKWLREQFEARRAKAGAIIQKAEELMREAEAELAAAVSGVSEVYGSEVQLSKALAGSGNDPTRVHKKLSRGITSVRGLADEVSALLAKKPRRHKK